MNEPATSTTRNKTPEIALITNHGYPCPKIPTGGATDTGGQHHYVNTLALSMEKLGYKVTIFSRGGFPQFQTKKLRVKTENFSKNVRYVYVIGGGDHFIRKEDIAIALDEENEWLYNFINKEAKTKGCQPWEVYEFLNSHYWDAAVMGTKLIEKWRNDMVALSLERLLEGIIPKNDIREMHDNRHWAAIGEKPALHLGMLLLNQKSIQNHELKQQVRSAASCWAIAKGLGPNEENFLVDSTEQALEPMESAIEPQFKRLGAAAALGQAMLMQSPDADDTLKRNLDRIDRHIWTPHSLGELKDYNFRDRPLDMRRKLKFCERRSHERMVCNKTRGFVATSSRIAEYLWLNYNVPVETTFYFPPCVDRTIFRPYKEAELDKTYQYLRKVTRLSIQKLKKSTVVFETSRMDRTKRKDLLISAFSKIVDDYEDLLLFIGGGPENELYQSLRRMLAENKNLKNKAFILGPIPDDQIGPLFSLADVYATASEMEGYGMCVSQAASAGTPVASSDLIPYSLYHVPDCLEIFPAGDANAFAKVIRKLLDDEKLRNEYSEKLIKKAELLDWETKTKDFINYLEEKNIIDTGE